MSHDMGAWGARALRGFAFLALAGAAACASQPENRPLGEAKRAIEQRQTQNPDAGQEKKTAQGVDPGTAAAILGNYQTNQSTEVQERRQDRQRDRGISEIGRQD